MKKIKEGQIWVGSLPNKIVKIVEVTPKGLIIYQDYDCEGKKYNYVSEPDEFKSAYDLIEDVREVGTAYLEVDSDNCLNIKVEGCVYIMGWIDDDGYCNIQSWSRTHKGTELWKEHGCKVDSSTVEWKGGMYRLIAEYLERTDIGRGIIWNFKACGPAFNCEDINIQRYKNGTPKIF